MPPIKCLLFRRGCFFISLILMLNIVSAGCAPLRKKFIRRKKETKKTVEPILDPIEYPSAIVDPETIYKKNYSLWKIWERDFDQAFDRGDTDKKLKFVLSKYLFHLEQMKAQLMPQDQEVFQGLIDKGYAVQKELKKPQPIRNDTQLRWDIKRLSRQIRHKFHPKLELNYR